MKRPSNGLSPLRPTGLAASCSRPLRDAPVASARRGPRACSCSGSEARRAGRAVSVRTGPLSSAYRSPPALGRQAMRENGSPAACLAVVVRPGWDLQFE